MISLVTVLMLCVTVGLPSKVKAEKDSYYWSLYPETATDRRIFGYDSAKNKSLESDPLPLNVLPKRKNGLMGMFVPKGGEAVLGNFAAECFAEGTVCGDFAISFLVYIDASVANDKFVHVLNTMSPSKGYYYIGFTVTRNIARLEAEAYVVAGKSLNILKKSGTFPGTGKWVHVAIAYSGLQEVLELYLDSQKTTDPVLSILWNGTDQGAKIVLGNTKTSSAFLISEFQILKGRTTDDDVEQLDLESRNHAQNPLRSQVKFVQKSPLVVKENQGSFDVELQRKGNLSTLSLLTISSSGEATPGEDFVFAKLPISGEVQIKPGEKFIHFTVVIADDTVPEANETLVIILTAADRGTSIVGAGKLNVSIIDNDVNECAPNPCLNGANCTDGDNKYNCTCNTGYTGKNCEIDIDDCAADLCKNNGTCIDRVNNYSCTCSRGFTGNNCETDIDDCESAPCKHHGICYDGQNDFKCICATGYSGKDCRIEVKKGTRTHTFGLAVGGGTLFVIIVLIILLLARKWNTRKSVSYSPAQRLLSDGF